MNAAAPTATCSACERPVLVAGLCFDHVERAALVREVERLRGRVAELERENRYLVGVAGRSR